MRSRYTAFAEGNVEHLKQTLHPDSRADFDAEATRKWSKQSEWLGLEIVDARGGEDEPGDANGDDSSDEGIVEFVASYRAGGKRVDHREIATFARHPGEGKAGSRWYFVDGQAPKPRTVVREAPKAGRNDPCPCGSGQKYKKCCG
jgi:SEC-C motif-containing protein